MFCPECGKNIPDGYAFCTSCGARIAEYEQPKTAPAPASVPAPEPADEQPCAESKKSKKGLIITLCASGAAVIAIVVLLFFLFGGKKSDFKSVAKEYVRAFTAADYNGIKNTLAYDCDVFFEDCIAANDYKSKNEIIEDMEDNYGIIITEKDNLLKKNCEGLKKYIAEEFGDYTLEITVVDYEPMTEDEILEYIYSLEDEVAVADYIKEEKIKEGYIVEVEANAYIKKDGEMRSDVKEVAVVKYGGKWKVIDYLEF